MEIENIYNKITTFKVDKYKTDCSEITVDIINNKIDGKSLNGISHKNMIPKDQDVIFDGFIEQPKPYFQGYLSGTGKDYVPTCTTTNNLGFITSATATLEITIAGIYFVQASQLISSSDSVYMKIRKNDAQIKAGFAPGAMSTFDIKVQGIFECEVGDTLSIYYAGPGTVTSAWDGGHSSFNCFLISA